MNEPRHNPSAAQTHAAASVELLAEMLERFDEATAAGATP
jgi:hypothetical protein